VPARAKKFRHNGDQGTSVSFTNATAESPFNPHIMLRNAVRSTVHRPNVLVANSTRFVCAFCVTNPRHFHSSPPGYSIEHATAKTERSKAATKQMVDSLLQEARNKKQKGSKASSKPGGKPGAKPGAKTKAKSKPKEKLKESKPRKTKEKVKAPEKKAKSTGTARKAEDVSMLCLISLCLRLTVSRRVGCQSRQQ
jgi:hypothetical protein